MGNTLFDQLKKTGLIDEKKAKQAKQEKRQKTKKKKKDRQAQVQSESTIKANQAQAIKVARDRQLNQQRKEAAELKAKRAQIKQLIEENRIADSEGEVGFNFVDNAKVRRIFVTDQVQEQLARGSVVIVKLGHRYDLVPAEVAEKIKHRDPLCVVASSTGCTEGSKEEDPYKDFQVPDDLMW